MQDNPAALIVVVDDDESVREATTSLLRSNRFRAATFASAQEFLESDILTQISCLLLDIEMPGISGLELQRRLKSLAPWIPIIFVTAHGDPNIRVEAMRAGAVDYLTKPFSEDALLKVMGRALKSSPCQ